MGEWAMTKLIKLVNFFSQSIRIDTSEENRVWGDF